MLQRVVRAAAPRRWAMALPCIQAPVLRTWQASTAALPYTARFMSANRSQKVPLNEEIRAQFVNVVAESGEIREGVDKRAAVKEARKMGVDLVQVALVPSKVPGAPPVVLCKMFDFKKKATSSAKATVESRMKGDKDVEYKANIASNDELVKNKRVQGFLEKGHPVNLVISWGNRAERKPAGLELYDRILAFIEAPYVVGKFKVNNTGARARLNPTKRATAKSVPRDADSQPGDQKDSMWFGVNPLRWNRPTGVHPRAVRSSRHRGRNGSAKAVVAPLEPIVPAPNQPPTPTPPTNDGLRRQASPPTEPNNVLTDTDEVGAHTVQTLYGHAGGVCALLASDDRYIISCSMDMTLRVWSRGSLNCHHVLKGHRDVVCALDLSSDYLVSGSHDGTVGVWLCHHDFRLRMRFEGHSGHVTKVQIVSGAIVLSGAEDHTLRLWSLETWAALRVLAGHNGYISCWLFLSTKCWSGGADATVCVWALDAPQPVHVFDRSHRKTIQSLVDLGNRTIASASNDGTIQVYDADALRWIATIDVGAPVYQLQVAKTKYLLASTGHGHVLLYGLHGTKTAALELSQDVRLHEQWIPHLAVRGNFAACAAESVLFVLDVRSFEVVVKVETHQGLVHAIAWLHSTAVLTCGKDGVIKAFKFPHLPL
ncbi:hypothetical protein ACHHYP_08855 [Achlya hypogyna]|uniref:Translation initiation factor 3 N-terminal domain-containing protein n=1 Tax=Achlya hypogyna TaxID=1202772 RepID=A0A1V9YP01_ACHHY|nr:hypothetical protein ACHHYP_08855 [Achlya hypogyna]